MFSSQYSLRFRSSTDERKQKRVSLTSLLQGYHAPSHCLLELDLGCLFSARFGLERFLQFQMEQETVGEAVGKYAQGCIEYLHCLVIACARHIDPVLCTLKLMLEILKTLVCLEVRIFFHHDHQS